MIIEVGGFSTGASQAAALIRHLQDDVRALGGTDRYAPGMRIGLAGDVAISAEEMAALVQDLTLSSVVVVVAVLLALFVFYRWARSLPALFLPLALAAVYAFGLASLPPFRITELNSNTAFLGSIIIGNGINFGIIQLARYVEARRNGRDRRGRAGHRAVGDPLGDAVGGDGGGGRVRVAGRDAVPRVPAVRRHRRPGDGVRLADDRRADAAACWPGWTAGRRAPQPHRSSGRIMGAVARMVARPAAPVRGAGGAADGAVDLGGAALRARSARVRLFAAAPARHLGRPARATGASGWTPCWGGT